MIQQRTLLKVLGGFKKKYAKLGDIIIVSIQQLRNKSKKVSKVKKKEVYKALIIRTKVKCRNRAGYEKLFEENAVILLNKQENPIGTRILKFFPYYLKKKKLQKCISISPGLV